MARFRCNICNREDEDSYPPDDTCLKCKKGTVRMLEKSECVMDCYRTMREDLKLRASVV